MSAQLQFGGNVPFVDRRTGAKIEVRVWGIFAGAGIDAHEEQPIKEWIMNALASSALSFDGDVHALPTMVDEWGAYVSQQISPQLAQHFNAHGQLLIQGVQIAGGAAPIKQSAPQPAMAPAGGPSLLDAAAAALSARMGASPDQARQAAAIVLEVVQAHGGGKDAYAKAAPVSHAQDPYAKDPYGKDAYGKDAYGKDPYATDPHAKDPHAKDPYATDPHAKDPYAKEPEWKK